MIGPEGAQPTGSCRYQKKAPIIIKEMRVRVGGSQSAYQYLDRDVFFFFSFFPFEVHSARRAWKPSLLSNHPGSWETCIPISFSLFRNKTIRKAQRRCSGIQDPYLLSLFITLSRRRRMGVLRTCFLVILTHSLLYSTDRACSLLLFIDLIILTFRGPCSSSVANRAKPDAKTFILILLPISLPCVAV